MYIYIYINRMRSPYGSYGRTPTKHKTSDAPRPKGSQIKFAIFKVSHLTWPDRNGRTGLFTYFLLSVLVFACTSKGAAPPDALTLCIQHIYIYSSPDALTLAMHKMYRLQVENTALKKQVAHPAITRLICVDVLYNARREHTKFHSYF